MKNCSGPFCGVPRPLSSFGSCSSRADGLQAYCRDCTREFERRRYRKRREMTTPVVVELEPDLEYDRREASVETEEPPRKRRKADYSDALYIMEVDCGNEEHTATMRSICGLKIGRSFDADERARSLSRSMPFVLKVLAEFPGCAHIEHEVHAALAGFQNTSGPGREWFHVDFGRAVETVGQVLQRSSKHAVSPRSGSDASR